MHRYRNLASNSVAVRNIANLRTSLILINIIELQSRIHENLFVAGVMSRLAGLCAFTILTAAASVVRIPYRLR